MIRRLLALAAVTLLGLTAAPAVNMYDSGNLGSVTLFQYQPLAGVPGIINMLAAGQAKFDNAAWTKTNIQDTTFATKTTAPDGTTTAQKDIANVTNGAHQIASIAFNRSLTVQTYRCFVDAKAAEYTRVILGASDGVSSGVQTVFDLAGVRQGVAPTPFGSGPFSGSNVTATSIGYGFVRSQYDITTNVGAKVQIYIQIDSGSGTGATSASFAGDGINGIYLWQVSCLPVHAYDLISRPFNDNFTSLTPIDVNNTKAGGFNWYVNNAWPNAGDGGSSSANWRSNLPQQAADFTTDGASVTALIARSITGQTLTSAVTDGGSSYIGRTFTLPQYMEATYSFDPTLSTTTATSWPIDWSFCMEFLTGQATHCVENDIGEMNHQSGTVAPDTAFHDWVISGSTSTNLQTGVATANFAALGLTYTNQNRFGTLWISQSANGGTYGLRQTYVNGVYLNNSEVAYSSSTAASPTFAGNSASVAPCSCGIFSVGDTQHFPFMIAAGTGAGGVGNWPIKITNAQVWCPAAGCMTQNFMLKRDLDPAANDNSPMWVGMVG